MTTNAFTQREQALENEFFHRVDQDLIERIREKTHNEALRERLAEVTGIRDRGIVDELLQSGITAENMIALTLVPLVHVARADRVLDERERRAVLAAAKEVGIAEDTASYELVADWLNRKSTSELFEVWRHYVKWLSTVARTAHLEHLKDEITRRAKAVARSAGGILGIGSISNSEEQVLAEITAAFGTDCSGS